ncbi:hypothetical protein KM043_001926 [Ampulex compressa]|nr:hypothetical protein KM043_001926 [Ampulex compressa]
MRRFRRSFRRRKKPVYPLKGPSDVSLAIFKFRKPYIRNNVYWVVIRRSRPKFHDGIQSSSKNAYLLNFKRYIFIDLQQYHISSCTLASADQEGIGVGQLIIDFLFS